MRASFLVGWRQVFVCFMMLAAVGMIAATYSIIAVPLAREYQPSRAVLMLSMTVLSGTCAALSPLFGRMMDHVSLRRLMPVGGLLLAVGYALISLTTEFWQVLLIFGLFMAPANVILGPVGMTVLLARWFVERRGRAVGIAIAGISAGGFLFPIIIQALLDAYEWRVALQLLGVVLFVWTVPMSLLVINHPADRALNADGKADLPEAAKIETSAAPITVGQILRDPAFWMIAGTVAIVTAGMKGLVTNLAPMAIDNDVDATDGAFLISIFFASSFIAKLSFAALSDRLGPRMLVSIALAGFGLGIACLTQAWAGYWLIALGVAITGLFGGLMVPIESYLAPRVFGQRAVGQAIGLLSGTILLGLLCTPPLFGLIFDLTGSYNGIFWTFSGLAFLALLWVPAIRLHPRTYTIPDKGSGERGT